MSIFLEPDSSLPRLRGPFEHEDIFRISAAIFQVRDALLAMLDASDQRMGQQDGDAFGTASYNQDILLAEIRALGLLAATGSEADLAMLCARVRVTVLAACRKQVQKVRIVRHDGDDVGGRG